MDHLRFLPPFQKVFMCSVCFVISFLVTPSLTQHCSHAPSIHIDGLVILGGMFNIHGSGTAGSGCGSEINPDAVQRLEAFLYMVDLLNKQEFVPGITFGAYAYDTCGQVHTSVAKALDFLARREANSYGNSCNLWPHFAGMVGPSDSGPSQDVAALLTSARINQIGYGAHLSELSNKETYPFFLRTVPDGKHVAQVLADVLKELDWRDVIVIAEDNLYATELLQNFLETSGKEEICVTRVINLSRKNIVDDDVVAVLSELPEKGISGVVLMTTPELTFQFFDKVNRAAEFFHPQLLKLHWVMGLPFHDHYRFRNLTRIVRGLISIEEHGGTIKGFRDYFLNQTPESNARNPWFAEYWEQIHNCTVGKTCNNRHPFLHARLYKQAIYVPQVVASVNAYAHALKTAQESLCNNTVAQPCPALGSLSTERLNTYLKNTLFVNLDNTIVSFDEEGNLANPTYAIKNLQVDRFSYRLNEVGQWSHNKGLEMSSPFKMYSTEGQGLVEYPMSFCHLESCRCQNDLVDNSIGQEKSADLLLIGMFDIHGNNEAGDKCDLREFHDESIQALEAMYYAIDVINNDPDVLPGVSLSGVALDTCRNSRRTRKQLMNLIQDVSGMGKAEGKRTIGGFIGPATSQVSIAITELSKAYRLPQISYSASSTKLKNKVEYPYFLRTAPSDESHAQAIVDILKYFNWTYVITVFSDNEDNKGAAREFLRLAEEQSVCVATQLQIETYFAKDRTAMGNIAKFYLREGFPESRVVILFVTEKDARALFRAVRLHSTPKSKRITWVGSLAWGNRQSVVENNEDIASGAITITQYSQPIASFMDYFRRIRPGDDRLRNPWFDTYWQRTFQCHLRSKYKRLYNASCDPRWTLQNEKISMSSTVPYVIDAVYSIALGVHKVIKHHCQGHVAWPPCKDAMANMDNAIHFIKDVSFYNTITNSTVVYDALGDSVPRYSIHKFYKEKGTFSYVEVGNWIDGKLTMKKKTLDLLDDRNKTFLSACAECLCSKRLLADLKFQMKYARLTLLGYFPVHETGEQGKLCGTFRSASGFLRYMAFKYATERVNEDPNILQNVTLGYLAFDTCADSKNAALVFNAFDKTLRFFTQPPQVPGITYINAFIGGFDDDVIASLNKASRTGQRLTQISPGSTSVADPETMEEYSALLQTSSSFLDRINALIELLTSFKWTYMSIVNDDSNSSKRKASQLQHRLEQETICIANMETISKEDDAEQHLSIIQSLISLEGARVVILLLEGELLSDFLKAASTVRISRKLLWIDFGDSRQSGYFFTGNPSLAGSFAVVEDLETDPYFNAYMQRLKLTSDPDNPWISEFWQHHFQCSLRYEKGNRKSCTGRESMENFDNGVDSSITSTINGVYSFAYGLTQLFKDRCGGVRMPPCDAIRLDERINEVVYEYIKKTKFIGADRKPFAYSQKGTGPARYTVFQYQLGNEDVLFRETEQLVKVGSWQDETLVLNQSLLRHLTDDNGDLLQSRCEGVCNCSFSKSVAKQLNTSNVPLVFEGTDTVWGICVTAVSSVGAFISLVTIVFFVSKKEHPMVRSSCPFSIILLLGILCTSALNFAFLLSPTPVTCGVRRLGTGLSYSLMFSCLLVKAGRINGIYNKVRSPYFMSGPNQTVAALLLVLIELVLVVEWLIIQPPDVYWTSGITTPTSGIPAYRIMWHCSHTNSSLVVSLVYVYILVLVTLVLAAKARKAAGFHKEALSILITSAGTIVVLLCWGSVYVAGEAELRIPAVCIGLTTNASLVQVVMFFPKMAELTSADGHSRQSDDVCDDVVHAVSTRPYITPRKRSYRPQQERRVDEHLNQSYECREFEHNPVYDNYNGCDGQGY